MWSSWWKTFLFTADVIVFGLAFTLPNAWACAAVALAATGAGIYMFAKFIEPPPAQEETATKAD